MLEVTDMVGAHDNSLVHPFQEANMIFEASHHPFLTGAVGKPRWTINRHFHLITFNQTKSFSSVWVHKNRVGMDNFRRVFPVTGTTLRVDVPLKGRENESVVG